MASSEQHAETRETPERANGPSARPPVFSVPDFPSLVPDVELLGEMQETGFKNPQCLVRCGDRFVQLTELLYRVAEQADGKSTHGEMAEGVIPSPFE